MEELKILLQKILNKDLQQIILSNSRHPEQTQKVKIRPVLIREELLFQETAYRGTQVFHENFTAEQLTTGSAPPYRSSSGRENSQRRPCRPPLWSAKKAS